MSLIPSRVATAMRDDWDDDRSYDEWDTGLSYELLANTRRRECVRYFVNHSDEEVSVRELADAVAETLSEDPPASEKLRQSVYTSLTQYHLSKLDGHDVLDYDPGEMTVSTGPNFETLASVTGVENSKAQPVNSVVLAISLVTCVALLVAVPVYPGLPALPLLGIATLNLLPAGLFLQTLVTGTDSKP